MEERSGWERPGYFLKKGTVEVQPYDWYGEYGNEPNKDQTYVNLLKKDYKFSFPDHHDLVNHSISLYNLNFFKIKFLRLEKKQ